MSKEISDEHIHVAAYYIWVAEGFPEGMAEMHWERARAALTLLTPAEVPEEGTVTAEMEPEATKEQTTELKAKPTPASTAAARRAATPVA